jgi:imidazolonepropionase-like amidohydrolase
MRDTVSPAAEGRERETKYHEGESPGCVSGSLPRGTLPRASRGSATRGGLTSYLCHLRHLRIARENILLLPIVLAIAVAVSAEQDAARTIAIVDATVLPMTANATVLTNHTVIVRDKRISAVGPAAKTPVPPDALRIDGRGKFLTPGLADMHVHLEYFDQPDILGLFVANGVTTIRNMDGRPYLLEWKKKAAAGELTIPRIYTAGPLLDGNPPVRPDNTVVTSMAEAREQVEQQAAAGYDFIKVYSALSSEVFREILAAASSKKIPVAGHVPRAIGIDAALASGLRSIEHLADYASAIEADTSPFKGKGHWSKRYLSAPIDSERLATLAEKHAKAGTWSVPTLIQPLRELLRADEIKNRLASDEVHYIPASGRNQWQEMATRIASRMDSEDWALVADAARNRGQVVKAFHNGGVAIASGTDTPNLFVVPGFSLHDELGLLVEAGLSPADALAASTREAARLVSSTDWGTIAAGRSADLVLLQGNPLDAIANTRRIEGVMLGGRWVSGEDRRAILEAIARTNR